LTGSTLELSILFKLCVCVSVCVKAMTITFLTFVMVDGYWGHQVCSVHCSTIFQTPVRAISGIWQRVMCAWSCPHWCWWMMTIQSMQHWSGLPTVNVQCLDTPPQPGCAIMWLVTQAGGLITMERWALA